MDDAIAGFLNSLKADITAAHLPAACERRAGWWLEQAPALYADYRRTNESRFGDDLGRLFRALLGLLAEVHLQFPQADPLAQGIAGRLHTFHEEHGLPLLAVKAPKPPPLRRKQRTSR